MPLHPFDPVRAALVASWAVGEEEVRSWWAADGDVVPAEAVAEWSETDDVEAYLFAEDAGPYVAYGELWLDHEEGDLELAHLVVAPERRGQGVGRALVQALAEQARHAHPELSLVVLRVQPENDQAIRAYTAAGFVPVPDDQQEAWNQGQRATYHWMVLPG
jgi:ribosomal protein S18 acetylase RimI-like enzyme